MKSNNRQAGDNASEELDPTLAEPVLPTELSTSNGISGLEDTAQLDALRAEIMDESAGLDALPPPPSQKITVREGKSTLKIKGYEILGELGRGGMGVVYHARQEGLNREVALKVIRHSDHVDRDQLQRFQREAEAVAQLQHPNIVQIYEVGLQPSGLPYFSLEYVEGGSLDKPLREKPLPADQAALLVETLARTMHFAHQRGIVHRDLKPANVLLTEDGQPKISDFGLVKRLEDDDGQTRTGAVVGTPNYMAPEQGRAEKDVGPAADVYALGAILYASLIGRPPFMAGSAVETVMQVLNDEPVPPSRLRRSIPKDLETICLKCLQKDPKKRYDSAQQLAEDLRRYSADEPIMARPVSRVERTWRWCRRNPKTASATAIAAFLALVLMIGGPIMAYIMYDLKEIAVTQEIAAKFRANEAETAREEAEVAREEAVASEQQTRAARDELIDTLKTLVVDVQAQLEDRADMQDLRKNLLEDAIAKLGKVAENVEDTMNIDINAAHAHRNMGEIFHTAGQTRAALEQYLICNDIVASLIKDNKLTRPEGNLGNSYERLGIMQLALGNAQAAHQWFEQSLQQRQAWSVKEPELWVRRYEAQSLGWLGRVAELAGDPRAALEYHQRAYEIRKLLADQSDELNEKKAQMELAGTEGSIGTAFLQLGDADEAIQYYNRSLDRQRKWANSEFVSDPANQAIFQSRKGEAYIWGGKPEKAIPLYEEAHELLSRLAERSPGDLRLKRSLANVKYGLGAAYLESDPQRSRQYFDECLQLRRMISDTDSENFPARVGLMLALARTGQRSEAIAIAEELRNQDPHDIRRLYQIACCYAICAAGADQTQREEYVAQAIAAIRQAVASGFKGGAKLDLEPDLAAVRDHPQFRALIAELAK